MLGVALASFATRPQRGYTNPQTAFRPTPAGPITTRSEVTALSRIITAFRAFWATLTRPDFASRVELLLLPTKEQADLRVLGLLQRDGRLVDFLKEPIEGYADAQIGASVREIHRASSKALGEYLAIEPVIDSEEGHAVTVPADFDPAAIRLTGRVPDAPPFQGVLKHHGWWVRSVKLPAMPVSRDGVPILEPAEVKIE